MDDRPHPSVRDGELRSLEAGDRPRGNVLLRSPAAVLRPEHRPAGQGQPEEGDVRLRPPRPGAPRPVRNTAGEGPHGDARPRDAGLGHRLPP